MLPIVIADAKYHLDKKSLPMLTLAIADAKPNLNKKSLTMLHLAISEAMQHLEGFANVTSFNCRGYAAFKKALSMLPLTIAEAKEHVRRLCQSYPLLLQKLSII